MWFDSASKIAEIAVKNGTSVFIVPDKIPVHIKHSVVIQPEAKATISIDQIRTLQARFNLRQTTDQFIIIRPAGAMTPEAANALLKHLEEPRPHLHFVLITSSPADLLPTILSRAAIYFLRQTPAFTTEITASTKDKALAKRLITATPIDLVNIVESINKKKDKRAAALSLLSLSIEMLYKSYFITEKPIFLKKLPKFFRAYDNISQNGHVKLQLIANLC